MKRRRLFSLLCALPLILFSTCALTGNVPLPKPPHIEAPSSLTLLFAGDIMAHTPNFSMADYGKIWEAVTPLVSSCDLSFANIESPVMTSRAFSTYPDFNMQPTYPEAAIKAGFNVFSTANNHSNDQGLEGIQETRAWADAMEEQYKNAPRPLYFSGIRTQKDGNFSYRIIQVKDWTVLFCAVTELLNRNTFTAYLNYVPSRKEARAQFKAFLHNLRAQNPCDLFVLSIHSDEPEYVADVSEGRQKYYRALLDCGVDVVWANHPHVVRGWQSVGQSETGMTHKLIMYGNGNTISAQRTKPQFTKPETPRDDTGDGLLLEARFAKRTASSPVLTETRAHFITTYITEKREFIIKYLNDDFISELDANKNTQWASYLKERKKITEQHKDNPIWQ